MNYLKRIGWGVLLLGLLQAEVYAQQTDHWRVTVQDITLYPLADFGEGRIVAGRGKHAQETFYVANYQTSQVLLAVPLPHTVHAATISADGQSFIVSTMEHTYRVDLKEGTARLVLKGVAGTVALDPTGERLAVLGNVNVDLPYSRRSVSDEAKLCVYDMKTGQWLAKIDTPIRSNPLVTFDGNQVIAAGTAGFVGGRSRKSAYPWHCQFDLKTGKASFPRGTGEYGETLPSGLQGDGSGGSRESDYEFPPPIQRLQASMTSIYPDPRGNVDRGKFTSHSRGYVGTVEAMVADDQRIAAVVSNATRGLLTISQTGDVTLRAAPVQPVSWVYVYRGRLVQKGEDRGQQNVDDRVTDVETGEVLTTVPTFPTQPYRDRKRWQRFVGSGWLVVDQDRLSYYVPRSTAPLWEREAPNDVGAYRVIVGSQDGSRLFICQSQRTAAFYVLNAATGQTLMQPPFDPRDDSSIWVDNAAFNHDGSKLMIGYTTHGRGTNPAVVTSTRWIREYDVASGQVTFQRELRKQEHYEIVISSGQKWIFSTNDASLFIDQQTHQEVSLPYGKINISHPIPGRQDQALLVENTQLSKAIVTPAGMVLRAWYTNATDSSTLNPRQTSCVAFGGKVIARATRACEIELLDAHTFTPFATVHVLQSDQGFQWIVYTPDGYWDASPGAEKFVLVTRNGSVVAPADLQSRRAASLLKSRLPKQHRRVALPPSAV